MRTPEPSRQFSDRPSRGITAALFLMLAFGAACLLVGTSTGDSNRAWAAFLVNFLFWTSIAHFGVVFGVVMSLSRARWGSAYLRLAQSLAAFLPLSFLLFVVFVVGARNLFPWVREPIPEKALWLNYPFMAVRDGFGLFVLLILSLAFLFYSLRPDAWRLKGHGTRWAEPLYGVLTTNFGDWKTELEHCRRRVALLAPAVAVVYCFVFSLLAGDLVMSLSPHWYSTLFGAYYFVCSFYLGLAALAVLSGLLGRSRVRAIVSDDERHDLGKLLFGFCLVSFDMFWSQYLVIWYANIPEEASFFAVRIQQPTWLLFSWVVLLACFALPFLLLMSRAAKRNSTFLTALAGLIMLGYWLERILLVIPSVSPSFEFGWIEAGLAGGFLALFTLSVLTFLRVFPLSTLESDSVESAPLPRPL